MQPAEGLIAWGIYIININWSFSEIDFLFSRYIKLGVVTHGINFKIKDDDILAYARPT